MGFDDRLCDRESEAAAAGVAAAPGIRAVEAVEDASSCSGGIPGPSSLTANRTESPASSTATLTVPSGPSWRTALETRLRSTWASRSGSASIEPLGWGDLEALGAEQRHIALEVGEQVRERHQAGFQQRPALGARQQQQVPHEPVHAGHQQLPRLRLRVSVVAPGEQLDPAAQHQSGLRSSWEASETNSRWRRNPVSSRSSMLLKASATMPTSSAPA